MTILSTDLDALECRTLSRPCAVRRRRGVDYETDLTVAEMGAMVAQAELWLRAHGRSMLGQVGTLAWIAERRAARAPLPRAFRVRDGELEAGLVWLATRGLIEVEGEDGDERYRWTTNATDERLARWAR